MKRLVIVDGNEADEKKVKEALGESYSVSSISRFEINNMALSTVITIANIIDAKDAYSGGHALRVAVCAKDIANNLGWDERTCQNIYFVALLHDIGMMTIPDSILHKPGRLDDLEYEEVKKHPENGAEMLRDITVVEGLAEGILYHHERWDGAGYPKGLKGEDIPVMARVISVANAYDAMNSDRVYRPRLSRDKIISEFIRCSGTQFDPDITEVFVFMLKEGYVVDPKIEQTREASMRAVADGGLHNVFAREDSSSEEEMDTLTGLFTRSYLNTMVGKKISEERSGALMIIAITGFDELKANYGEEELDRIVKDFSVRLQSLFREADVVSSISRNMFAIYVSGQSGKNIVEKKAAMIASIADEYDEFIKYRDLMGVAIGISLCEEDGLTFEELYSSADTALSAAAREGKNIYRFK